jgi:C_GCAxxG_C_C family probable redox protein
MNKAEKAHAEMIAHNTNCAQTTINVFEDLGLDKETALKITLGFGGGMGGTGSTCGAVVAAYMVMGLRLPLDPEKPRAQREKINAQIARFNKQFIARHGSLICKTLKASAKKSGLDNSCPNLVKSAVEILEEMKE